MKFLRKVLNKEGFSGNSENVSEILYQSVNLLSLNFNNLYMMNQIKTVLLLGVLSGIVLVIGKLLGGNIGLTIALVFAIIMNFSAYFFSHKIVLFMYKAKEAPKSKYPHLHELVEEIAEEAKIPKPKVYIVPSESPNAFATGPGYKNSIIAVTEGIIGLLSKEELKGVLAHEIAHVKNRDMLISTIAATMAAVIAYIANIAQFAAIFGGRDEEEGGNIIGFLLMAILAPIAAMLIQLAISRSREYIADETGAKLIKNSKPLASALLKLESGGKNHPLKMGSTSTNHMWVVHPFRGQGGVFLNLFMTHPPISSRVERLNKMKF